MTAPRRRVLRSSAAEQTSDRQRQQTREKYLAKLAKEQQAFHRWLTRLKRAFHALEKQERKVARLEKTLARLS